MAPRTTADVDIMARRFKALSDPHRLRILDRLRAGEKCVCDLTDVLGAGQSLLSFHLKTLKDAGLVVDRREGRWAYYELNVEALEEMDEFLGSLRRRAKAADWKPCCS
jgi:ArsR family transcriptional regulator